MFHVVFCIFVGYFYVSCSGSITSVGEERDTLSSIVFTCNYVVSQAGFHYMPSDPRVRAWGWGYRIKIQYSLECDISAFKFSRSAYLDNYLSEGIHIGPYVPCEIGFHFMPSDPRVHACEWGYRVKIQFMLKCGVSGLKFSRILYFDNHLSESNHSRTKGTL